MQAVQYGDRFYFQDLHFQEIGLSMLTAAFCNANRDPKQGRSYRPADFQSFKEIYESFEPRLLPAAVCNTFLWLAKECKLPPWVLLVAPVDDIRKGKRGETLCHPKGWIAKGAVAIAPSKEGGEVFIELLIVDEDTEGLVTFYDIETDELVCQILLPKRAEGAYYVTEAEFKCQMEP